MKVYYNTKNNFRKCFSGFSNDIDHGAIILRILRECSVESAFASCIFSFHRKFPAFVQRGHDSEFEDNTLWQLETYANENLATILDHLYL